MSLGTAPTQNTLAHGPALMQRLDALARFSEDPDRLTRTFLSQAHRQAADQVLAWMRDAGMDARTDAAGNVVGRYEGDRPGLPALLLGSHIDTVRDAGRYDGNLGVLAAIAVIGELHRRGERLPFAVEVLAFGDEEGVRFPVTLTGSATVAGTVDPAVADALDHDGVRLGDALRGFGGDPDALEGEARRRDRVLGYVELHIEQGPVLEAEDLPLGVVTAINGAARYNATVRGMAGHAGTVPMDLRHDALAAAASMILAVERCAQSRRDVVATVGQLDVQPGAVNVIPGAVRFTIDIRAPDDADRLAAMAEMTAALEGIARGRGVELALERYHDAAAVRCDEALMARLETAIRRHGLPARRLPSGAGHDAMAMAALAPVAMLFLRCRGGISHNPAESITVEDADLAVRVLLDLLRQYDHA
ncbi:allantoate amidohydrolase [Inquilinus limosus]|uniref:Allantoate amidohydrolase n=1 Tax=Inquilinus limosus TaxID=171674 RepID=A0A211ZT57_9PROT|nr:allantoate amidohydrolase [Inquilinus limosus]OWJ68433.1 allantoate amidohydrolase [Inquilinus limosus]